MHLSHRYWYVKIDSTSFPHNYVIFSGLGEEKFTSFTFTSIPSQSLSAFPEADLSPANYTLVSLNQQPPYQSFMWRGAQTRQRKSMVWALLCQAFVCFNFMLLKFNPQYDMSWQRMEGAQSFTVTIILSIIESNPSWNFHPKGPIPQNSIA